MEETTLPDLNQESQDGPRNSPIRSDLDEGSAAKNSFSPELVARALGSGSFQGDDPRHNNGDFFDCNLCLSSATEPVLTCCGHLFCWPCFYNLPYEFSNVKDCPVCGGDVVDTSLVPIYGNNEDPEPSSSSSRKRKSFSSGLEVPPRPKAKRVENPIQQRRLRYERGELMDVRIEQRIRELTAVAVRFVERARTVSPAIESASLQRSEALRFSSLVLQQAGPEELSSSNAETNPTQIESANLRRLEALDFSGLVEQRPSSLRNSEELRNDADSNPTPIPPLSGYQYFVSQSLPPIPNLRFILPDIDLSASSETFVENPEELSTRIGREEELPSNGNANTDSTTAAARSSHRISPGLARWLEMPYYGSEFDDEPLSLASPTAPSSADGPSLRGGVPRES